jgi:hypothetical protein
VLCDGGVLGSADGCLVCLVRRQARRGMLVIAWCCEHGWYGRGRLGMCTVFGSLWW